MLSRKRSGQSTLALVAEVSLLVALVATVSYFVNGRFRDRTNQAYRQLTEWTPERIVQNPEGYLEFAREQIHQSLYQLRAADLKATQQKTLLEERMQQARRHLETSQRAVSMLGSAYRQAASQDQWPLAWANGQLDQEEAERTLLQLQADADRQQELLNQLSRTGESLMEHRFELSEQIDRAEQQLVQLEQHRVLLAERQLTEDLLGEMEALRDALVAARVATHLEPLPTAAELPDLAAIPLDRERLQSILESKHEQ